MIGQKEAYSRRDENLKRLESATLLLGSESDVDYTLLGSVVLQWIFRQ